MRRSRVLAAAVIAAAAALAGCQPSHNGTDHNVQLQPPTSTAAPVAEPSEGAATLPPDNAGNANAAAAAAAGCQPFHNGIDHNAQPQPQPQPPTSAVAPAVEPTDGAVAPQPAPTDGAMAPQPAPADGAVAPQPAPTDGAVAPQPDPAGGGDNTPAAGDCAGGGSTPAPGAAGAGTPGADTVAPPAAQGADAQKPATPALWGQPVMTEDFNGSGLPAGWGVYDAPDAKQFPRSAAATALTGAGQLRMTGGFDAQGRDVSGGIAQNYNQKYGRWEARLRADKGTGYSAVALLWPQSENWPTDGEIDMVEVSDGNRQNAGTFLHNGAGNQVRGTQVKADFTQWHTVAVDWLPDHVTYYLDGVETLTVRDPGLVPSTSPMHMALQFDKGCMEQLPCRNADTPQQVSMFVDWMRVYRYPGG